MTPCLLLWFYSFFRWPIHIRVTITAPFNSDQCAIINTLAICDKHRTNKPWPLQPRKLLMVTWALLWILQVYDYHRSMTVATEETIHGEHQCCGAGAGPFWPETEHFGPAPAPQPRLRTIYIGGYTCSVPILFWTVFFLKKRPVLWTLKFLVSTIREKIYTK